MGTVVQVEGGEASEASSLTPASSKNGNGKTNRRKELSTFEVPEIPVSPKSLHIENSCHQAVQLFWVTMESVLLMEDARLGTMDMQQKIIRIGQLLNSEAFHRALLACAAEIVFVGNKVYTHLFPHSLYTFRVKPLVMFSVIRTFIGARPDLPTAFKNHLQWCDDCIVGQISWQGKLL